MKLHRSLAWFLSALALLAAGGWAWRASPQPAPAVSYTLLDGRQGRTETHRGKVLIVNFWATSCSVCVAEMPQLVATHEKFKSRGLDTLAVAMQRDPPAYVAHFAQSRGLPFGVAIDNTGEIARRFGDVQETPSTFVIDRQGRIVQRFVGAPDFAALHSLLDRLLGDAG